MKFSIKDFFSKCDQIQRKLWICSHLLKKSLMENLIFCAALVNIFWFIVKIAATIILQNTFSTLLIMVGSALKLP